MKYRVTAKYIESRAADFYKKLTDGSIESQKPDGREIVASMKRAKITEPGIIQWYETCYCPKPLQHEREAVYDRYLEEMSAREVDQFQEVPGNQSFWAYLERISSD